MKLSKVRTLALTASAAAVACASSANAAVLVLDVTGFASGFDIDGIFGVGGVLNEVAFSQRFTIDDGVPGANPFGSATSSGVSSNFGPSVVANVFTINGKNISFGVGGSQDAGVFKSVSGGTGSFDIAVFDTAGGVSVIGNRLSFNSSDPDFVSSSDYRTPFSIGISGSSGTVQYGFVDNLPDYRGNTIYLNLRPLTARLTAAVPEPASWALMIGGFGMIGGTLRRRQTVTRSVRSA